MKCMSLCLRFLQRLHVCVAVFGLATAINRKTNSGSAGGPLKVQNATPPLSLNRTNNSVPLRGRLEMQNTTLAAGLNQTSNNSGPLRGRLEIQSVTPPVGLKHTKNSRALTGRLDIKNVTPPVSLAHHKGSAKRHGVEHKAASKADALAALQDFETSVAASKAEALSAYDKIDSWCSFQKSAFVSASDSQNTKSSALITTITQKAGLQAQLEHEVEKVNEKLAEQQDSLSQTLSQQYSEETEYNAKTTELTERSKVLSNVIEDMKEKALSSLQVAKVAEFLTTAVGAPLSSNAVSSTKSSPLSTLMGVLAGIHKEVEDELAKAKKEQEEKRIQYNEIIAAYEKEITTCETSAETEADRLRTATMALHGAKLEREACQGLAKEDEELLMAITTVCSEKDFAERKKDKVHEQFAADLKDARALLSSSFLTLDWRRHKMAFVLNASNPQLSQFHADSSFKVSFSGPKAQKKSTLVSLRRLIVSRHQDDPTPIECKKERIAATAELNSARSDVQYLTDAKAREEANETAYGTASQAIFQTTEPDKLGTDSTTLKKEVEDFGTAGETKADEAQTHLDSADTKVEAYFDSIDKSGSASSSKLQAQILLSRMRDTLKEWKDDGLDDLKQLAQMVGQVGDRAVEIKNARTTRANDLSTASQAAKARKGELQTQLDAAKSRLSSAKDSFDAVKSKCTATTSFIASDLQVFASQWKINGHLVPEVLKVAVQMLGIKEPKGMLHLS